ncbi:inositol monophosphatase family protein [Sphingomonas sp. MMS24-J13]|uniref:inositol monophosphatase family protein n=1 Tax=Sphingomonas sp. MMS24-J13 TaxID=3238686 RepID=UPI00384BE9A0
MQSLDETTLLRLIRPAADLASSFAARRHRLRIEEKGPGDFASEADRTVENAIRAALRAEYGEVAIIGEEAGGTLDAAASGWAIDPIDGTSNFLRGLPLWGVSIGLLDRGTSVAGVVALPEFGTTITAIRGEGARLNGVLLPLAPPAIGGKLIALGENEFEPGTQTDRRADALRREGYAVVRYRCAVFALMSAALGRLDGYIEHGCCLWDIAAAAVICREAGMAVTASEIAPGRYAIDARRGG